MKLFVFALLWAAVSAGVVYLLMPYIYLWGNWMAIYKFHVGLMWVVGVLMAAITIYGEA